MVTVHTTYQLRGHLSKGKHERLDAAMRQCATLYNAALQERRDAYRMAGASVTLYDQTKQFTGIRADDPNWGDLDVGIGRGVLRRIDRAYNAFFRRVKAGETPGFPRFKSGRRWRTIDLALTHKGMVKVSADGRKAWVRIKGLPAIELRLKRPLPSSEHLKAIRIVRRPVGVYVDLVYEVEHKHLPESPHAVGLDFGVNVRIATSDGELIDSRPAGRKSRGGRRFPAVASASEHHANGASPDGIDTIASQEVSLDAMEPTEIAHGSRLPTPVSLDAMEPTQRKYPPVTTPTVSLDAMEPDMDESPSSYADLERRIAKCKRGSNNQRKLYRQLARIRHRDRIRNRNHCHRITSGLVHQYGRIAVEKLTIPNMVRSAAGTIEEPGTNVAQKRGLNREIQQATWGLLREQLRYKAEWAGREFVEVNPRYTSRECWSCGHQTPQSEYRRYRCGVCGTSFDRDINAAINVLRRAWPDAIGEGISPPLF